MRRRTILAAGTALAAATAGGAWLTSSGRGGSRAVLLPSAPPGDERLEQRLSTARGRVVDFYTAVPAGYGDGRGLPVCLVLHGGSKTARDFSSLGLGRFLTDVVQRGVAPFILAGATGDRLAWRPHAGDDPQRMVREELPAWCAARGFDRTRLAVWGWSMGGYGALLLAETFPGLVRAVAAFSPAVEPGDDVFTGVDQLEGTPTGLWCGTDDSLYGNTRALHRALPAPPVAGGYTEGRHNFSYWSTVIPAAFQFVAAALHAGASVAAGAKAGVGRTARI